MAGQESITLIGTTRRGIERRALSEFATSFANLRIDISEADETTRRIARAYAKAWGTARRTAREVSVHAAEQMHADNGFSARDVARLDRVDRALHSMERSIRDLNRFTGVEVKGAVNRTFEATVDTVLDALVDRTGIDRRFTTPNRARMEALVLRSTGRIESATRALDARQSAALREGLIRGLILGENPRETAKHIYRQTEGAFFGGLSRATTIVRTEAADANRYASQVAYNSTDLVVGWKWLASLSARTCPACWAMHNTFHEKSEIQYGHQNCRCTMVPVLADDLPADHDLGDPEAIFWNLPRDTQLQIMGPGRLKALEGGAPWELLTHLRHNPNWRPSQQTTSVADMTGLAELNVATFPGDVITVPGFTNASLMSMAFAQGGMTVQAATGDQPTSGYVVARDANSTVIDAREFFGPAGPTTVAAYLTRHGDLLDAPGAHLGLWYDTANGKVVLDIVEVLDDREAAIALGRAENQVAIFDLNTFSEIPTGGDGGYLDPITSALDAKGIPADLYRPYMDPLEGVDVHRMLDQWRDAVTLGDDTIAAFAKYQRNPVINRILRTPDHPDLANWQADIDALDRAFDQSRLPQPIHVYRGQDLEDYKALLGDDFTRVRDTILNREQPGPVDPDAVKVGDTLYWNGRTVTVEGIERKTEFGRETVFFDVRRAGDSPGFTLPVRSVYLTDRPPGEVPDLGLTGRVLSDDGYLSTTTSVTTATSFANGDKVPVRLELVVPAGYSAVSVETVTDQNVMGEDEVLLDRGTSYEVMGYRVEGDTLVIEGRVVPRDTFETALATGSFETPVTKVTKDDVGRTVTWKDGTFRGVGEVVDVFPTGATKVRDSSGREHFLFSDQILTVGDAEKIKSTARRLAEIAETGKRVHGIDVDYTGTSPEVAERIDTNLRDLRTDWTRIAPTGVRIGDAGSAFAVTSTSFPTPTAAVSDIQIEADYAQDAKKWQRDIASAESTGHFHGGTSDEPQEFTIDHEYGHVVDFRLFGHPGTPDGWATRMSIGADVLNALQVKAGLPEGQFSNDVRTPDGPNAQAVMDALNDPFWQQQVRLDLSGYAMMSPHELFAEAFAVYRDHGPGKSVVADAIMRRMVLAYRDEFGELPNERDLDVLLREGDR